MRMAVLLPAWQTKVERYGFIQGVGQKGVQCLLWMQNPAPPKGWLKSWKQWDKRINHLYELVQDFFESRGLEAKLMNRRRTTQ